MKNAMQDFLDSVIRTYVPLVVGAIAAWFLARGIDVPADVRASAVIALTAATQAGYYLAARLIEQYAPKFLPFPLLGRSKQPTYTDAPPEVEG